MERYCPTQHVLYMENPSVETEKDTKDIAETLMKCNRSEKLFQTTGLNVVGRPGPD